MTSEEEKSVSTNKDAALRRIHPVLVRPEGSGNIGAAVRAAKTMGLGNVRLVRPHAELDVETRKMSAGAIGALSTLESFDTLNEAIGDAVRVYGFSARRREHRAQPVWLGEIAEEAVGLAEHGSVVFLFGTERTGLENEELDLAHACVRIPTSEEFRSLNLAQSVMVTAYELRRLPGAEREKFHYQPAKAEEVENCVQALGAALDRRDFFIPEKREKALRRIRDLLGRALPNENEIALLRGMVRSLDEDPVIGLDGES